MTFVRKFKIGATGEDLLINTLRAYRYKRLVKNEDYDNRYAFDVIMIQPCFTFEVKYDIMAEKTGNLAIEYFNSKKKEPSGIMRSSADFWVHIINIDNTPTLFIANRLVLLKMMDSITPFKKIVAGGDKNSDMFIYKIGQLTGSDGPLVVLTREVALELLGEPQ